MLTINQFKKGNDHLRPYLRSSVISLIVLLTLTYFIAIVSRVEQDAAFQNYENIFFFTSYVSAIYFCIQVAIMLHRLNIIPFQGTIDKSQKQQFFNLVWKVLIFNFLMMLASYTLSIVTFIATEQIISIVPQSITIKTVISAIVSTVPLALMNMALGIITLQIGLITNSMKTMIGFSLLFIVIIGTILNDITNQTVEYMIYSGIILISLCVVFLLSYTLNPKKS